MSAYVVEKNHILYIVKAAVSVCLSPNSEYFYWGKNILQRRDRVKATEIANMLWQENIKSVQCRYAGKTEQKYGLKRALTPLF